MLNETEHEERLGGVGMKLQVAGESCVGLGEAFEVGESLAFKKKGVARTGILFRSPRHEYGGILPAASGKCCLTLVVGRHALGKDLRLASKQEEASADQREEPTQRGAMGLPQHRNSV